MADARWMGSFLSPSRMAWAVRGAQEGGISLTGGGSLAIWRPKGNIQDLCPPPYHLTAHAQSPPIPSFPRASWGIYCKAGEDHATASGESP